jgi:hypothetical protein
MVADLQTINDEQQDLIYKIEVMVSIRSASAQPPPQPSVLLELPPLPPSAEVVALIDQPPELTPTPPSVQPPEPPSATTAPTLIVPADATCLGLVPRSSSATSLSGLLKLPSAPPYAMAALASISATTTSVPPLPPCRGYRGYTVVGGITQ